MFTFQGQGHWRAFIAPGPSVISPYRMGSPHFKRDDYEYRLIVYPCKASSASPSEAEVQAYIDTVQDTVKQIWPFLTRVIAGVS
jgi:hypothetical protein